MLLGGNPWSLSFAYLFGRRGGGGPGGPLFLTDYGQTVGRTGRIGILG